MLIIKFNELGKAEEKLYIDNINLSEKLDNNQVLIEIILFPINPADILLVEGKYSNLPKLPSKIGAECIAKVIKTGKQVKSLSEGDFVMPLTRENWVQKKVVTESEVIKLSPNVNATQACMLKVNPATAYLMLNNYIKIEKGDYVIQNASNSGVGNYMIQLCQHYDIKTVNIIRRKNLSKDLLALGATKVIAEKELKSQLVQLKNNNIKLFLDAVGGPQILDILPALSNNGIIINYGLLSNKNLNITSHDIIFRNISIKGFWLSLWLEKMSRIEKNNLYNYLESLINKRILFTKVQKIYDISNIKEAVRVSKAYKRQGKILVSPNYQKYKNFF